MPRFTYPLLRLSRSRATFLVAIAGLLAANILAFDAVFDTSYVLWFVAAVLLVRVSAALVAALVVLAPPQYLTSLVCGAPWRILAERRFVYRRDNRSIAHWGWIPKDASPALGYEEAGFLSKPVTLTGLIAAPVLLLLANALDA